ARLRHARQLLPRLPTPHRPHPRQLPRRKPLIGWLVFCFLAPVRAGAQTKERARRRTSKGTCAQGAQAERISRGIFNPPATPCSFYGPCFRRLLKQGLFIGAR